MTTNAEWFAQQVAGQQARNVRVKVRKQAKKRDPQALDLRTPSGKPLPY